MKLNRLVIGAAMLLPASVALAQADEYVGDSVCAACHSNFPSTGFFDGYMDSGHPWKLFRTAGGEPAPDTWPFSAVPPLPSVFGAPLQWSDVEYVIGNYFWKARFVDRDGFIHTGDVDDSTQWNLWNQQFVPYHAGEADKPFDCGRCHTTGYDPAGHQNELPGLIGTWVQDGVRCEACHGPSSQHASDPGQFLPPGGKNCSECHYRDDQFRMPWKNGFMRHHQQAEDFSHSPHGNRLSCVTCHDPHKSTVYAQGGMTRECTSCHRSVDPVAGMESLQCTDCHMPAMGKSATSSGPYTGDVRGHIFQIRTDQVFAEDNVHDEGGSLFWNVDQFDRAWITLDYACLGCHDAMGDDLTMPEASAYARGIHQRVNCPADFNGDGNVDTLDFLAFLNAFNSGDPRADFNEDGSVNTLDFLAYLNAFAAGC